jgi:hypothetical protein
MQHANFNGISSKGGESGQTAECDGSGERLESKTTLHESFLK